MDPELDEIIDALLEYDIEDIVYEMRRMYKLFSAYKRVGEFSKEGETIKKMFEPYEEFV